MIIRTPFLALSLLLVAVAAGAQPPVPSAVRGDFPGPIVDGRQRQPTQQEIESRERAFNQRDAGSGLAYSHPSDTDLLYEQLMRDSAPSRD